jgi:hypothetical protein
LDKNGVEKTLQETKKLWYVRIPNYSENDCHGIELFINQVGGSLYKSGRIAQSEEPQNGIPRVPGSSLGQTAH